MIVWSIYVCYLLNLIQKNLNSVKCEDFVNPGRKGGYCMNDVSLDHSATHLIFKIIL